MKILHINRNYVDTPLHQLMVEQLDCLGYVNKVFSPRLNNEKSRIKPNDNVCVCECFSNFDKFFFNRKQKKIINSIQSSINVKQYDLIHAYTLFTDGNCARELSKKYNIPYVVAVRNTDVNDFFKLMPHLRRRGIQIMMDAKAVFFLSDSYRKQVFCKYVPKKIKDVLLKKTHIIPNGIDDFWFRNPPRSENKIDTSSVRLIYAGRIDKNKNIPTIQRAIKFLKQRGLNAQLTVVGRINDYKEYSKIIKDTNTRYFPPVTKEKLIDLYRDAHIFVMPSFCESFGLVYVEAMTQGLPVIYSKGQGFDGQFPDGVVGYSAISTSAESVAEGIIKIIDNYADIRTHLSDNAAKFNWSEICKEYDHVYQKV